MYGVSLLFSQEIKRLGTVLDKDGLEASLVSFENKICRLCPNDVRIT
jgi:hypothetical protein